MPEDMTLMTKHPTNMEINNPGSKTTMKIINSVNDLIEGTASSKDSILTESSPSTHDNNILGFNIEAIIIGFIAISVVIFGITFWIRRKPSQVTTNSPLKAPEKQDTQKNLSAATNCKDYPDRPTACLVQTSDPSNNDRFPIDGITTIIGRVEQATKDNVHYLRIDHSTISRKHAKIQYNTEGYWLTDLKSINGTFVNDKKVTDKVLLKNEDIIRFHNITFLFEVLLHEPYQVDKTIILEATKKEDKTIFLSAKDNKVQKPDNVVIEPTPTPVVSEPVIPTNFETTPKTTPAPVSKQESTADKVPASSPYEEEAILDKQVDLPPIQADKHSSSLPETQSADTQKSSSVAAINCQDSLDRPSARLVRSNDPLDNEHFIIDGTPTLIGRSAPDFNENPHYLQIHRNTISRKHAQIEYDAKGYWLIDLKSNNGTFVNDKKVTEKVLLNHGDMIRFYDIDFLFEILSPNTAGDDKTIFTEDRNSELSQVADHQSTTHAQLQSNKDKTIFLDTHQLEQFIKKNQEK